MNNPLYLADENFQPQHSGKCDLLIHLGRHSVEYAIIDKGQDQLKVLFSHPFADGESSAVKRLDHLQGEKHLNLHYRTVKLSVETPDFSFIPSELFLEQHLHDYSRFISQDEAAQTLVANIRSAGIKNIISVDAALQENLDRRFGSAHIYSQANPLIEGASRINRREGFQQLFLNFSPQSFEAAYLFHNKLNFYNTFETEGTDDFNYFLLNIIGQLNLDRERTEVILAGKIRQDSPEYKRITKYFNTITFADSRELAYQPGIFKQVPSHQFFSLISLYLCE